MLGAGIVLLAVAVLVVKHILIAIKIVRRRGLRLLIKDLNVARYDAASDE